MRIVFATNNLHKLEEVSAILGPRFEPVTPASLGITEDIPETADTLEGNALQKARYIHLRTGLDCFADDTGLEVTALGGAPGVRSARYAEDAGEADTGAGGHDFDANNRLLLRNLEGVADRSARFRTVVALILGTKGGDPEEHLFEGRVEGHITEEYRGTGGFGYDPIFAPDIRDDSHPGGARSAVGPPTFAEMSPEEKNAISHRARAVEKLARFLKNRNS
jgi:XTP/dITP diphosphohydrolase